MFSDIFDNEMSYLWAIPVEKKDKKKKSNRAKIWIKTSVFLHGGENN